MTCGLMLTAIEGMQLRLMQEIHKPDALWD